MKTLSKFGLLFVGLALVGVGCLGAKPAPAEVTGDWWLTFDLPAGWHMYTNYSKSIADPSSQPLTKSVTDVMIQNTELPIVLPGKTASKDVLNFQDKDYTFAHVFRYDVNLTRVPEEAKDLGNGWAEYTDDDGSKIYFMKGVHGIYRAYLGTDGQDTEVVKAIIFTAKEVTKAE